jgi:hypothetical protein
MGFQFGGTPIRLEEEEEEGAFRALTTGSLALPPKDNGDDQPTITAALAKAQAAAVKQLMDERTAILADGQLGPKEKLELLRENRRTIIVTTGGNIRTTDSVVYAILIFAGVVLVILAGMTAFGDLPVEVTLAFAGTTLGGTIATISQKLGRL